MDLRTVTMMRAEEAQTQIDLYATLPELTENEKAMMAIYDAIASGQGKMVDLRQVFNSNTFGHRANLLNLPSVAVAPVTASSVSWTRRRIREAGKGRKLIDTFSTGSWSYQHSIGVRKDDPYSVGSAKAQLPSILPTVRPQLEDGDLILWEPTWTDTKLDRYQRPDPDPAILRHIHGSVYRVVAAWDLTAVELMILGS